jgi:hypothetical protein
LNTKKGHPASRFTISTTYGLISKGPWGIERLLEVEYDIYYISRTCYEVFSCYVV